MKKLIFTILVFSGAIAAHAQVTSLWGNGTPNYYNSGFAADTVNTAFNMPYGGAYDRLGNFWITDMGNNFIVLIDKKTGTYELREGYNAGGFLDGASVGQFGGLSYYPAGICVVPGAKIANDQYYLCDGGNNAIRKIDSFVALGQAQAMSTVCGGGTKVQGSPGQSGYANGSPSATRFKNPIGIGYVSDASGGWLVVADNGNNAIRKVSLHKTDYGTSSTLTTGISEPQGIFVDHAGNIYVASATNGQGVMKVSGTGAVTTVVSGTYLAGPTSVVIRRNMMYIADGCRIMQFDMTQSESATNPSLLAGDINDTICSFKDGSDKSSRFNGISSMTISPDSSFLVVADAQNNRFRKVMLAPLTTHTSGIQNEVSAADGFQVFPNPTSGRVTITGYTSANANISLLTITGKELMRTNAAMIAGAPFDFSLAGQPAGIYVLQVATANSVYTKKIILQ